MLLRSLANKILLTMVTVILVMSTAFLMYFVFYVTRVMERRAIHESMGAVTNLARSAELGILTEEERFLKGPFRGVLSDPETAYVIAYDNAGRVIASESKVTIDPTLSRDVIERMRVSQEPVTADSSISGLPDATDYFAPVLMGAETYDEAAGLLDEEDEDMPRHGTLIGIVRIGISGTEIMVARRRILIFGMTVVLATFAITAIAIVLLSRHFTRPLVSLREGVSRIAKGDLDFHIGVKSRDEIGELANSFNTMTSELQRTTVSKNYVDNVLGSMVDTLVVVDADGVIRTVNHALLRLLGYREEELVGQPFTKILRNESILTGPAWRRFHETGVLKNFEINYVGKHGESIPVNFNGSLMVDRMRNAKSIVGVAHDMREVKRLMVDIERRRRETEQARYEAEFQQSRLTFLLGALSEGVVMLDPQGEVVVINQVARRFFNFSVDEVVSRERLRGVEWFELDDVLAEMDASETKTVVREIELELPEKRVIKTVATEVRSSDGRLVGTLLVLQDISEERELDRMRDEFVVTVSHDLRTPLTTIKGFISLLLSEKVGSLTEKQHKFLAHIEESAQHLHTLINDLLDLSRIRAGKLVVDIKSVDLRRIAEESVHLFKPSAEHKGVALNLLTTADACIAEVDPERMKEALNNLIGNALKFTEDNGEIIIEILNYPGEAELRVSDTGSGIAQQDLELIFEKFRSIPGKTTDEQVSSGIGLSIVKGIVDAHHGRLWVESELGRGSTFFIRIPKKQQSDASNTA